MSLILDALRKSEAERRRGQTPSLYAAMPVPGTRARPAWLRWLPLVALAVLVAVALFTWLGEPGLATKGDLETEAGAADSEVIVGDEVVPADATQDAASANAVAAAPVPSSAAAVAPTPTVDALVKPAVAAPITTAPAPSPTIVAAPAPAPVETAPAAEPSPVEQLPPVAVLDPGTRSNLPAMKLSMHVYNGDAARRFAIIDGQRVTEGSQVGAATVVEIRRDGVVLEVGGTRVLLPRP